MSLELFVNNKSTTLGSTVASGDTTITLATGGGTGFPTPSAGQFFTVTLNDSATGTLYEICNCTSRTGDVLTVTRAQQGTVAQIWQIGDIAFNGPTAGTMAGFAQTSAIYYPYSDDTGSVNHLIATLSPVPSAYTTGMRIDLKVEHTNTASTDINVNGLGIKTVLFSGSTLDASALVAGRMYRFVYNGTSFDMTSPTSPATRPEVSSGGNPNQMIVPSSLAASAQSGDFVYGTAGGSANALTLTLAPVPAAYVAGMTLKVLLTATNTTAATINVNGLGVKNIYFNGAALGASALTSGNVVTLIYDGTQFQLQNVGSATLVSSNYSSGSWYRIWSDGFIEQGIHIAPFPNGSSAFTWPVAFPNFISTSVPGASSFEASSGSGSAYTNPYPSLTGGTAWTNNGAGQSIGVDIEAKGK